jgi:hypothetical protein
MLENGLECLGAEEKKGVDYKEVLLKEGPGLISKVVDIAQGKSSTPLPVQQPQSGAQPAWVVPAAVAGGAGVLGLLAYFGLRK